MKVRSWWQKRETALYDRGFSVWSDFVLCNSFGVGRSAVQLTVESNTRIQTKAVSLISCGTTFQIIHLFSGPREPPIWQDLLSLENDFPSRAHCLARWFGLRDFVVLSPASQSDSINTESRANILLSSISIALGNTSW